MFAQMKMATRIGLGFSLRILLMAALALFAMQRIGTVNDQSTPVTPNGLPGLKRVQPNYVAASAELGQVVDLNEKAGIKASQAGDRVYAAVRL